MNLRRFLAEAGALAVLAIACALVSNAFAAKERRLELPGDYPAAFSVPKPPAPVPFERHPAPAADEPAPPASAAPAVPDRPAPSAPAPAPGSRRPAADREPAPPPQERPAASSPSSPAAPDHVAEVLARFPPHGQPGVEITGEAAAWLHARGALFLDARRSKDFVEKHVAGARSFPIWEAAVVKERVEELVAEGRDQTLPVVLYCTGGDCEDSHMLAQTLFGAGFENLLVYRDGFPDWLSRGGAVATGRGR
ncbi:MAG TPA: rhodanese-like domain-containing protein [Thermoanaerobaculia bacterium]|jgi:rhodanese-related sulfurtransferase|nr:rhodanese-like domain-containing protein [Thermoanaerobaculia bacterium]HPA51137.1 rhodanese-like domain-containing protein [Thermoanaerobaculia bacterium]HQN08187.1 rhodanese-like domain-containing protein [Thermoanaerobaculia bacterium]HQP85876.1 rhodanese-like domain-containing protein [Thermoanaerobaculia bacterium]